MSIRPEAQRLGGCEGSNEGIDSTSNIAGNATEVSAGDELLQVNEQPLMAPAQNLPIA